MSTRARVGQLGLGELLDRSFRIYRGGFGTFVAIAALVYVPYMLLNFLLMLPFNRELRRIAATLTPASVTSGEAAVFELLGGLFVLSLGVIGLGLLYILLFQPLLHGALARAVARHHLGQPISLGDSFGAALRRAWALTGSRLLTAVLGTSLLIIGFGVYFTALFLLISSTAQSDTLGPSIGGLVALGLFAVGIIIAGAGLLLFVWTRLVFTVQAAMIEQHGAWNSVQRSWQLTRRSFRRTLSFMVGIGLLGWVATILPLLLLSLPLTFVFPGNATLQALLSTLISCAVTVIVTPFSAIAFTALYYDMRVRAEALDLEQRAEQLLPVPGYAPGTL